MKEAVTEAATGAKAEAEAEADRITREVQVQGRG
jgi:hypothetical protein